jgi:hypothetical protein
MAEDILIPLGGMVMTGWIFYTIVAGPLEVRPLPARGGLVVSLRDVNCADDVAAEQ